MLSQWLGGGLVGRPWSLLSRTVLWAYLQLPCSQMIVTAVLVDGWLFISQEGMERVIRPLLKCQTTPPSQLYTVFSLTVHGSQVSEQGETGGRETYLSS